MAKKKQITFTFLEHDAVSKNKRIYTKEAVQAMVKAAQADLAGGKVILSSFATHDYARAENATKMVGKLSRVWEDGTKVKATLDLFDTTHANDLAAVVKGEGIKTVSLRADDFAVTGKKTVINGEDYDQVSRCHLAGVDFAMRPGLDMAQIESFAFEDEQDSSLTRDIVACENEPGAVLLIEAEDKETEMTKEEIQALIDTALGAAAEKATALERQSHAHPHKHKGGDGKDYTHEHKHGHSDADSKGEDHLHEHGNPYEDLGAYSLADLAKAASERFALYATDGTPAHVLEGAVKYVADAAAVLTKAGLIKESANPLETTLTEEVANGKALTEQVIALTAERDRALAKATEAATTITALEAAKTEAEAEAAKAAEALIQAGRPGGRRVPVGEIVEHALAEVGVKRPDEEIPAGQEYKAGIRGWAAAYTAEHS